MLSRPTFFVLAVLALLLTLFSFREAGSDLLTAWQSEEYSHGIIIPFVALLIAWHRLTSLRPVCAPSWWGIPVLLAAALLQLTGRLAAFATPSEYASIIALFGLSLALLGRNATRVMLPAFIYLFFAVPLPRLIYVALSQNLQLISSTFGVWCLDLLNFSVYQEGNIIDLGGYKLQVAEACSGLRYLFPLLSFSYLVAYLLEDRMWKRAVILISAIPITVFMNSLRIATIGITVNAWGIHMAEGFLHLFEGWVVFLLCVLLLMAEVMLLKAGRLRFDYLGPAKGALFSGFRLAYAPVLAAVLLSSVCAALLGSRFVEERIEILPSHPAFAGFPTLLGSWHALPRNLEPSALEELQLSDYWLADYSRSGDAAPVNLYIAYYASQRTGSSAHSPSNCIPGGGWQVETKRTKTLTLAGGELTVSRLTIRRAGTTQLVYFWFDERGRNLTENYSAKWYLFVDSITQHRTDGALVRLVTPIVKDETEALAEKRLEDLLALAYPKLRSFIPGSYP